MNQCSTYASVLFLPNVTTPTQLSRGSFNTFRSTHALVTHPLQHNIVCSRF